MLRLQRFKKHENYIILVEVILACVPCLFQCSRHCKYCFGHEYLSIYLDEEKKGHVKKKQKWGYQISAAVNTNSFSPGFCLFLGLGITGS